VLVVGCGILSACKTPQQTTATTEGVIGDLESLRDAVSSGLLVAKQAKEECSCMFVTYHVPTSYIPDQAIAPASGAPAPGANVFQDRQKVCATFASETSAVEISTKYSFDGRYAHVQASVTGIISRNMTDKGTAYAVFDSQHPELGCVFTGFDPKNTVPAWLDHYQSMATNL